MLRKSFIHLSVWFAVDSSQESSNLVFSLYSSLICLSLLLHWFSELIPILQWGTACVRTVVSCKGFLPGGCFVFLFLLFMSVFLCLFLCLLQLYCSLVTSSLQSYSSISFNFLKDFDCSRPPLLQWWIWVLKVSNAFFFFWLCEICHTLSVNESVLWLNSTRKTFPCSPWK